VKLRARMTARSARRGRRPLLESLETRSVLSSDCGVTCDLMDGMLHVRGTTGDDSIAVQYDSASQTLQVIGGEQELVGTYSLADVRSLNVEGFTGNDRFSLDDSLPIAVKLNGGEGEDSLAAHPVGDLHGHEQGTAAALALSHFGLEDVNLELSPNSAAGTTLAAVIETDSYSPLDAAPLNSSLQLTEHGSHSIGAAASPIESQSLHHAGLMATSANVTFTGLSTHNHTPAALYAGGSTAGAVSGFATGLVYATSLTLEQVDPGLQESQSHAQSHTEFEAPSKLVPKRCTVTYAGGLVVTSVDGKRQCDCEQKQNAAEATSQQLFAPDQAAAAQGIAVSFVVNCLPCQDSAWLSHVPGVGGVCLASFGSPAGQPAGDAHTAAPSVCSQEAAADRYAAESAAVWMEGLQAIGWSLVGASAIILPLLRPRQQDDEQDRPARPAVDWLFGRIGLERLAR
jgi:hypothetical protein